MGLKRYRSHRKTDGLKVIIVTFVDGTTAELAVPSSHPLAEAEHWSVFECDDLPVKQNREKPRHRRYKARAHTS